MSNSQRWAIWGVVAAMFFLISAFVGGTWLAVVAYLLARAMASIGILVLMAGALNMVKRSKG